MNEGTTKRHRDAAKLMIDYWRDYMVTPVADEPNADDLALIRRIERILNGTALFPVSDG